MYNTYDIIEIKGEIYVKESAIKTSFETFEEAIAFIIKLPKRKLLLYLNSLPYDQMMTFYNILTQIVIQVFKSYYKPKESNEIKTRNTNESEAIFLDSIHNNIPTLIDDISRSWTIRPSTATAELAPDHSSISEEEEEI